MDWSDRATAVLFGDGAGATLVRPATGTRGILSTYMKSDGTLAELLYRPGGGALHPPSEELLKDHSYFIQMAGREVFKAAVLSMADACDQALRRAGLTGADVDLLIPHQANIRIIEATAKHAGMPMDKVYVNVDRYGNTSAASIAIALDEAVRTGRLTARHDGHAGRLRRRVHVGQHGRAVVAGPTVWLCPGQGAQKVGMGKDLAERFPAARDTFDRHRRGARRARSRASCSTAPRRAHPHPERAARDSRAHGGGLCRGRREGGRRGRGRRPLARRVLGLRHGRGAQRRRSRARSCGGAAS